MKVSTTLRLFLLIALFTAAQMLRLSAQGQAHQPQDQEHRSSESSDEKNVSDSNQQTPTALGPNERLVRIQNFNNFFLRPLQDKVSIGSNNGPESIWIQIKNEDGTFRFRTQQKFGRYITCPKRPADNQSITVKQSWQPFDQSFFVTDAGNGLVKIQCPENSQSELGIDGIGNAKLISVNQNEQYRRWSIVNA